MASLEVRPALSHENHVKDGTAFGTLPPKMGPRRSAREQHTEKVTEKESDTMIPSYYHAPDHSEGATGCVDQTTRPATCSEVVNHATAALDKLDKDEEQGR